MQVHLYISGTGVIRKLSPGKRVFFRVVRPVQDQMYPCDPLQVPRIFKDFFPIFTMTDAADSAKKRWEGSHGYKPMCRGF